MSPSFRPSGSLLFALVCLPPGGHPIPPPYPDRQFLCGLSHVPTPTGAAHTHLSGLDSAWILPSPAFGPKKQVIPPVLSWGTCSGLAGHQVGSARGRFPESAPCTVPGPCGPHASSCAMRQAEVTQWSFSFHSVTCPLGHWVAGQREALRARIPASPLLGSSGPGPAACSAPEERGALVFLQVPCTVRRARASPGGGEMTWVPPILGGSLSSFPAFCIPNSSPNASPVDFMSYHHPPLGYLHTCFP